MSKTIIAIAIAALLTTLPTRAEKEDAMLRDIRTITQRVLTTFLSSQTISPDKVETLLKGLESNGTWKGVEYTERHVGANWPVFFKHYIAAATLTRALKAPDSPYRNNPKLKAATLSAVGAWLREDWRITSWWYDKIGGPLTLGPILLALEDDLTPEQIQQGIAILERGKIGMTGANKAWLAQVTFYRGLLIQSPEVIQSAVRAIEESITLGKEEGIQYDWSFFQHGRCLYTNGYGSPFLNAAAGTAVLTTGTAFAMNPALIERIISTTLDGNQWMVFAPAQDYGANGRSITRPGLSSSYLIPIVNALLQLPSNRKEELAALKAHLKDPAANPPKVGNRHFWRADIMTHKRKGYYASARMYSRRTLSTDTAIGTGEGLRSHYLADGCNYLFRDGKEYWDIFGAWDWQKVPGTTVVQNGDFSGNPGQMGQTDFVGGVSDGMYGAAAFDLVRDTTLKARKAWFFFDDEYVCLGAGISSPSDAVVFTTLNQCYLRGTVQQLAGDTLRLLPSDSYTLTGPLALHHDGVAYFLPGTQSILLKTVPQTGKWSDSTKANRVEQDEMTTDMFLLGINHGRKPENAAYAYIVAPGMEADKMAAYAANPAVEILSNTPALQAVQHKTLGITQAVFYQAGALTVDGKALISVDQPCIVMLRTQPDGLHLTAADPTQKLTTLHVTLSGNPPLTLDLPTGGLAGKSVETVLNEVTE